jgi:hypothetical protein
MPPNARQHFVVHPALELLGFWLARLVDELVEAGFVNRCETLCSTKGVTSSYTLFVVIQTGHSLANVTQA